MNKYEVHFYNRFACENQVFYVLAKHKKQARDIFLRKYNREKYGLAMSDIVVEKYYEPVFYTPYDKLYDELVLIANELRKYYDIDKIKPYSIYVWSKNSTGDYGDNIFDITADKIVFYENLEKFDGSNYDESIIVKESNPIIERIQLKLKEIKNLSK